MTPTLQAPRLWLIKNVNDSPCRLCGEIFPFFTKCPLDNAHATAHAPAPEALMHIPVAYEDRSYIPPDLVAVPLDEYPGLGERIHIQRPLDSQEDIT